MALDTGSELACDYKDCSSKGTRDYGYLYYEGPNAVEGESKESLTRPANPQWSITATPPTDADIQAVLPAPPPGALLLPVVRHRLPRPQYDARLPKSPPQPSPTMFLHQELHHPSHIHMGEPDLRRTPPARPLPVLRARHFPLPPILFRVGILQKSC